jgi:hypothetical protein
MIAGSLSSSTAGFRRSCRSSRSWLPCLMRAKCLPLKQRSTKCGTKPVKRDEDQLTRFQSLPDHHARTTVVSWPNEVKVRCEDRTDRAQHRSAGPDDLREPRRQDETLRTVDPGHSSDGPSWIDLVAIRINTTESRFQACLNRLLQQYLPKGDVIAQLWRADRCCQSKVSAALDRSAFRPSKDYILWPYPTDGGIKPPFV